jgi:hypothetical protein
MSANRRRRFDHEDTGPPFVSSATDPGPQESASGGEFQPLRGELKHTEQMAELEDFKLKSRSAPE